MKRIIPFLLLLISLTAAGQYNNEWIKYSQTYYKLKIVNKGLYRISKSALDAAGIGNTPVEFFELWKNGQQVPFHTTNSSGPLGAGGYIEFWGEGNDGKPDKPLYRNPAYQHSTEYSLFTDTAIYFLSVNTTQAGFRYTDPGNDVASNALAPEPYFMHKASNYFRNIINKGFAAVVGEYVYSASYDKGEFWSSPAIRPATPLVSNQTNLQVYASGPGATLRYGAMGDALNARSLKVYVNGTMMQESVLDYFNDVIATVNVPLAQINTASTPIKFENTSAIASDRLVVSFYELTYPRTFNFDNKKYFKFSLPASGDKYLEITNFNYGSVAPILLNLTNGERMTGDISTPGTVKFVVKGGGQRDFVLVNAETSNSIAINSLVPKSFVDFSNPSNQGDYLIISNQVLFTGSHGNDPVAEYRNYRASSAGGGYNAKVVEIQEIVDQFAFGIKMDPLSIKNFLRYARNNFSTPPKFVFLIGRGMTYDEFRTRESNTVANQLLLVPTWGSPASDNMLSSEDASTPYAVTPIGRLSVIKGAEIENYLEKIKEYENVQKNAANTLADREWMKNVIHVTGSSDPYLGTVLCNYMGVYQQIIEDTVYGANVATFCKASTNTVEQLSSEKITQLFEDGISILTYFGHSSSTTLEFNLDNPQNYNNKGKYPIFFVNGCNAGNFFTFNNTRLLTDETLSEKYVLAKQRGSIAFVASTHFGIVNYLNIYLNNLYYTIARQDYGRSLGEVTRDALKRMVVLTGPSDFYARSHAEEITVHGDPALYFNEQPKPDFVIEDQEVRINPSFISVAEESFDLRVRMVNIGRSSDDSVYLEVKRQYPDGSSESIYKEKMAGIRYADSVTIHVPIIATRDKGTNKFTVIIDGDNEISEISESNNSITKDVIIFEDEARAVYPYQFAIVSDPATKFYASTDDPFSSVKDYVFEMDTTELFNSSLKITKKVTSVGGTIEFSPGISFKDSTVYYWRVSRVPQDAAEYRWSNSSFIYIKGDKEGFNQSHYFQQLYSSKERLTLDSDRKWRFGTIKNNLFFRLGTWVTSAVQENQMSISVNAGPGLIHNTCNFSALVFTVFDPVTFKPWVNVTDPNTGKGLYFSQGNTCYAGRQNNFEFLYTDSVSRRHAVEFMKNVVPSGAYVTVRAFVLDPVRFPSQKQAFISDWQKDTLVYGANNSLYHALYSAGFTELDSFYRARPWIFVYKKDEQDKFFPKMAVAQGTFDNITLSVDCITPDTVGYITSPKFGPAKEWNDVIWRGVSQEAPPNDNPVVSVIGIDVNGNEAKLFDLDKNEQNFDISGVSAAQYPYLKLRMRNIDSTTLTPYQLSFWRIHYTPVPEGAISPNVFVSVKDTLEIGEQMNFAVAFKNVSKYNFDSVGIKMYILDKNNVERVIPVPKQKPLVQGDTIIFRYALDTKDIVDNNTLFLEFNPDNGQPEQFHFNNFLFKTVYVKSDRTNPVMDVTFDGVHILNRDIVSARPHIQIKLKDEAKFLLLNDTALSSVQLRYPDGTMRTYHFDNDTLRFTPASSSVDNTAVVDFYPAFTDQFNAEGDEYELIVRGKDRSGNKAGDNEYRVAFTVITKAMISNLLNYPNPFSTSTAFVFTLTGSEVPQNMKIQILTVTGKIVREITKEELGPIHIGRNITEFKWDGTDQFGQRLANGVYLYRFVTTLNGNRMEKYKAKNDNTDTYFNNGYGKMYLMR